jgi:hypothetical protein
MVNQAITITSYGQDQQELVLEHINSDEDDIDEDDESAIQAYRQQRLKEFARISNPAVRRQQKVFGHVDDIDANEYASIIDTEWKSVPIVIHLYDEVSVSFHVEMNYSANVESLMHWSITSIPPCRAFPIVVRWMIYLRIWLENTRWQDLYVYPPLTWNLIWSDLPLSLATAEVCW